MSNKLSITKDITFWYVVESALKQYLNDYPVPGLANKVQEEISKAIDRHLEDSL